MKTEKEINELIARLFSKSITLEEKSQLYEWVKKTKDNQLYFKQMLNLWQVSHPAFDPEQIDSDKAVEKILKNLSSKNRIKLPFISWFQRVAAILIIPLMVLTGFLMKEKNNLTAEIVYQEVYSPIGTQSKINLPDGSKVWLNSGSRLKYPLAFAKGKRNVFLSGEAYFEVQSDKSNPFIVTTDKLSVTATGTAFNVEALSNDSIINVTLVHGKVNIDMGIFNIVKIRPNERLSYNVSSSKYDLSEIDPYKYCAWKDGVLAFRNDRLDFVFKEISSMYNVNIFIKDSIIASQLYRATFKDETLSEILNLIEMSAPIQIKRTKRMQLANGEFSKEKIEISSN